MRKLYFINISSDAVALGIWQWKFWYYTCCTQRMPNGNCTTINIDLFCIKPQLVAAIHKLGSKCLNKCKSSKLRTYTNGPKKKIEREREGAREGGNHIIKLIYFKETTIIPHLFQKGQYHQALDLQPSQQLELQQLGQHPWQQDQHQLQKMTYMTINKIIFFRL